MKMSKKTTWLMILTSIIYITNAILSLLTTYTIANVMKCVEIHNVETLTVSLILAVVVLFFQKLSGVSMTAINQWYLSDGVLSLRQKMINNMFRRPISVFRSKDDAYYMNVLSSDVNMYKDNCLSVYPWICYFIAYGSFSIYLLMKLNTWLGIATIVFSATPFLAEKFMSKFVEKYKNKNSVEYEKYIQTLKETIEGYETIRMCGNSTNFINRYNDANKSSRYASAKLTVADSISRESFFTAASLMRLIILAIGAFLVLKGQLLVATLYAAMDYGIAISNSFGNIADSIVKIKSTKTIRKKIESEIFEKEENETLKKTTALSISYTNISFDFENHKLFQNFSCSLEAGKCYAVLGESGCGKSTLLKLLLKYYDNYTGDICIGTTNIRDISGNDIYNLVGVVSQTPWFINASLYDNITMFSGYPSEDSLTYSKLLDNLKLTELSKRVGDDLLGDFGESISGGERQRINIARTMRKQTGILIFDEPTTGLDPESVDIINNYIFSLKNVTRIVISHDWSKNYLDRFDAIIRL